MKRDQIKDSAVLAAFDYLSSRYSQRFAERLTSEAQLIAVFARVYGRDTRLAESITPETAKPEEKKDDCIMPESKAYAITYAESCAAVEALSQINAAHRAIRSMAATIISECADAKEEFICLACNLLNKLNCYSSSCEDSDGNKYEIHSLDVARPQIRNDGTLKLTINKPLRCNWLGYGIAYIDDEFQPLANPETMAYCKEHFKNQLAVASKTVGCGTLSYIRNEGHINGKD